MSRSITQYLRALFTVFFRWWWAALTGFITILGVILTSEAGVTLGRVGIVIMLFVLSGFFFVAVSVIVVSWKWFVDAGVHPEIIRVVPEQPGKTPLTFLVTCPTPIAPGACLALFRVTEHDVEVCAAVLEVQAQRIDGKGYQATPKWISPVHQTALQKGDVRLDDLRVREVSTELVRLVEKRVREDTNA